MKSTDINGLKLHHSQDFKFGLITRTVTRVDTDRFTIDDTSSGWMTASVDTKTLEGLLSGKVSMLSLDWK